MAEAIVTLQQFLEMLGEAAKHAPDSELRINGECVFACSVSILNPIASVGTDAGYPVRVHDESRARVLDISTNGREPVPLPEMSYPDMRRAQRD